MTVLTRFLGHVRERRLIPAGARVVAACSGGADSTALVRLLALAAEPLELAGVVVAHLDHGLRHDSDSDLRAVTSLAADLGLPIAAERREVAREQGESPEEAARRVRLAFLVDVAASLGAGCVATAHHMDDQAETVLQRVLRGTGIEGLRGIPERRELGPGVDLVRPLLPFRRAELRAFCTAEGLGWREDPTNVSGNERARLRGRAFPVLAECTGRDPVPLLARLAENVPPPGENEADRVGRGFVAPGAAVLRLRAGFAHLPRALRGALLRRHAPALRSDRPLTREETDRLLSLVDGDDAREVSDLVVERTAAETRILPKPLPSTPPPAVPLAVPGVTALHDGWMLTTDVRPVTTHTLLDRLSRPAAELLDADRVAGALIAGVRLDGDRIRPLGGVEEVRLTHLFQRRGVTAAARARHPVVRDDAGIAWVPGVAIADRVRIAPETSRALLVRWSRD